MHLPSVAVLPWDVERGTLRSERATSTRFSEKRCARWSGKSGVSGHALVWRYAYRYGLSFYDLEIAEWETALQFWKDFEKKLKPGVEQQTCRLHQAKVLVEQHHFDEARTTLETGTEAVLAKQKEKVTAELTQSEAKK